MVDLTFKLDLGTGYTTIDPPRNWKDMRVQLIFDQKELQLQLQSISFEWVKKNAVLLDNYIQNGLTGGTGILEGPGLRIYGSLPGLTPVLIFDGCINTADEAFSFESDFIKCPIKESGRQDWFSDAAKGFTFEYLTSLSSGAPGRITRADYKQTPYTISSIPDYTQAMMLSISLFIIIKESVDVTAKLVSLVVRAVSQSLSWLQLIGTIVEIILYIIYLVAIVKASAILIQQISDNLIQPKKTKLCMKESDLFIKGCQYLGLGFVSSIYGVGTAAKYGGKYVNATTVPVKIKIPTGDPFNDIFERPADETTNIKSYGYFDGTFAQFIAEHEMIYHAKAIVKNNICYFEEINDFNIVDAFALPNEGVTGNTFLYPQAYGTNASEIPAVYELKVQKDEQDENTYNDYKGSYVLAQTIPAVVHNKKNQLLHGSVVIDLPFALARRKQYFTKIEKKLIDLLDQFGRFITNISDSTNHATSQMASLCPTFVTDTFQDGQIGLLEGLLTGNPAFALGAISLGAGGFAIIPTVTIPVYSNDRIGWMLLSSDFVGVRKRFIGTPSGADWYIDANNSESTYISAGTSFGSGAFTGTVIGITGYSVIVGTVTGGFLSCHGSGPLAPPGIYSGIVTGTIAGLPGTYTGFITGGIIGGVFTGNGSVNTMLPTTLTTGAWGSANSLLVDFHYTELIDYNQWLTFANKTFKFSMNDFLTIQNKNVLVTPDGKYGKFKKLMWWLFNDEVTDVNYRIKYKYTNNYNLRITNDGG